jgi:hypothetical protein
VAVEEQVEGGVGRVADDGDGRTGRSRPLPPPRGRRRWTGLTSSALLVCRVAPQQGCGGIANLAQV